MTAVEDRLAEQHALIAPAVRYVIEQNDIMPEPAFAALADVTGRWETALRAVLERQDVLDAEVGHQVYEATEMEPEECTDECPACAIADMYDAIAAALDVVEP